jgi:hypothetical protein
MIYEASAYYIYNTSKSARDMATMILAQWDGRVTDIPLIINSTKYSYDLLPSRPRRDPVICCRDPAYRGIGGNTLSQL